MVERYLLIATGIEFAKAFSNSINTIQAAESPTYWKITDIQSGEYEKNVLEFPFSFIRQGNWER
jgi:hypothetical protein